MPQFVDGALRFQADTFPSMADRFEELAHGQSPEALFITCSDSRIDPNLITSTRPGDLFVIRNAGNIVPPDIDQHGVSSSIEFAVRGLRVPHVVVCGHSGCGAIGAMMDPSTATGLPLVSEWVKHATRALGEDPELDEVIERNVLLQLEHLRTHPSVVERLEAGDIELHGWVYDIGSGQITRYDEGAGRFVPLGG